MRPLRFATHSRLVQTITTTHGWKPAARYTNLRDVRDFNEVGFVDIDWKAYDFRRHLEAVKTLRPHLTIAQDVLDEGDLPRILDQADELAEYATLVAVVPKAISLRDKMEEVVPAKFLFGYSTPSNYGGTEIEPSYFKRRVHLLGGSPKRQLQVAPQLDVYSFDCNRFTLDAKFGDFFDGTRFRPHPEGGYRRCLEDSVCAINEAWERVMLDKAHLTDVAA